MGRATKRRRTSGVRYKSGTPYAGGKAYKHKVAKSNRGYARTSGYYGRFSGPRGAEDKFFDGTRAQVTVTAAGLISNDSLNLIPQGVTESTRVGRKCTLKSLMLRGNCLLATTTIQANTDDTVRLIIYHDKQANGATAAIGDILDGTPVWNGFNNLANSQRFRILHSEFIEMNTLAGGGPTADDQYADTSKFFSCYKKLNMPLEFSSTTGAITEIRSNNIGVMLIGRAGLSSIEYRWRLRYSDL